MNTIILHRMDTHAIVFALDQIVAYTEKENCTEVYTASGMSFCVLEKMSAINDIIAEVPEEKADNSSFDTLPPWYFQPVERFLTELSARPLGCLNGAGISTVGELVRMSEYNLCKTRNLGKKSLSEIKTALNNKGLKLGMTDSEIFGAPINP